MPPPSPDPAETPGTTIVLVLETNPEYWRVAGDLDVALRQVLIFVNAHLSLSKRNRVVLIAMHADGKCHYLYESGSGADGGPRTPRRWTPSSATWGKGARRARRVAAAALARRRAGHRPLAAALSMAMCYANAHETARAPRAWSACRDPRTTRGNTSR